jgi:hypothetical protein
VTRQPGGRIISVTDTGRTGFSEQFGLQIIDGQATTSRAA